MGFFAAILQAIVLAIIGELLRPKPKLDKLKPSALSEFEFPGADPTRVISVWWGTCRFKGPNTTWFGDLKSIKKQKKIKTGWFSSDKIDLGFNYYLGVMQVMGWGDDTVELLDITVSEDEKTVINGSLVDNGDYFSMVMNSPNILVGSEDFDNGVTGPVKIYKGTSTQLHNAYLKAKWGESVTSAFRGLFYIVFEQCYLGNNDTPPPFQVTARRTPNTLGMTGGKENVNGDANIACALYEIMTENKYWGLARDPATIDTASFIACGETLYAEGLGISMTQGDSVRANDLQAEMLRHADAVVYRDPETFLWTMKLARDDYDEGTLDVYGNSEIVPGSFSFGRVSYAETRNVTVINYTSRLDNFVVKDATYVNPANIFARDNVVDLETIDFLGYSNKAQASYRAAIANKTHSSPLARCQFKLIAGKGRSIRPGSVIKVLKPDFGIVSPVVMRVLKYTVGSIDSPGVSVVCTEDIYAVNNEAFGAPEDTGWDPLYESTVNLARKRIVEVPYEMIDREKVHLMVLGSRGDDITEGFEVWSCNPSVGDLYLKKTNAARGTICSGLLAVDIPKATGGHIDDDFSIELTNVIDSHLLESITTTELYQGRNLLMVDDEIIGWRDAVLTEEIDGSVSAVISGLIRGVFHTVPRLHDGGDGNVVYFFDEDLPFVDPQPYELDEGGTTGARTVKLPTFARGQIMDLSVVPQIVATYDSLAVRPNPPGRVLFNGGRLGIEVSEPLEGRLKKIEWSNRSKYHVGLVGQQDESLGEPGVKARVQLYNEDTDTVMFEADNIVSPMTFGLPQAGGDPSSVNVRIRLWAVDADGEYSLQYQEFTVACGATDYGPEEYHVIYDEYFEQTDTVIELESVSGVFTIDCSLAEQFVLNLRSNASVVFINVPGNKIIIAKVKNYAAWTLDWPEQVMYATGEVYVASITGTDDLPKIDICGLFTDTGGIVFTLRATLDTTRDGTAVDEVPMVVEIAPNPAYGYAASAPSVGVVATVTGGTLPLTHLWERAPGGSGDWDSSTGGIGGPDFTISSTTVANPTFSRTGTADGQTAQNWRHTVEDAAGKKVLTVLEIALEDDGIIGGGTGGPTCPWGDAWCKPVGDNPAKQAREVKVDDAIVVVDPWTGIESLEIVTYARTAWVPGVRVHTMSGVVLTCSRTAPLPTKEGAMLDATKMIGEHTAVCIDGVWQWSMVIGVDDIFGLIEVRHITCGSKYFPVGDVLGAYMAHHNIKHDPDPFEGEV